MSTLTLTQVGPFAFQVQTDHWTIRIDTKDHATGPTPTELTAIALAACKAITVLKWSDKRQLGLHNISAEVRYEMAEKPARIGEIDVSLKNVKHQVPPELHPRLEASVDGCIVANTLKITSKMSHQIE